MNNYYLIDPVAVIDPNDYTVGRLLQLGRLMKYPQLESSTLEFKEALPKHEQIIKTAIGFCNMHGGKIIIGIKDDGEVIGLPEHEAHDLLGRLSKAIFDASAPPILPQVYLQHVDQKYVVVIDISSGMQKPYYLKSQGIDKGTYVRLGSSTLKADQQLVEELKLQARGKAFDQTPCYQATQTDLDMSKVKQFLGRRRNGSQVVLSHELLSAYEIITDEQAFNYPTICGILLFGHDPQQFLTESYILCSHFSGTQGRQAMATRICKGTLTEQFDLAYDFILEHINKSYVINDKRRQETYEIPPIAIREVLMNAILHRNYQLPAPIKIAIYANRVEIFSPGVFLGPMDLSQLESGITYTRNIAIAKILWEFGYVEKMGSGFITLFQSYRDAKLKKPDVIEGTNFIKCILYRPSRLNQLPHPEQEILGLFSMKDTITRTDVVKQLALSRTTAGRYLANLVASGQLQCLGSGRSTRYARL